MKVRLVKRQTIINYASQNTNGKASFDNWILKIKYADWEISNDIKETFNSADLLGNSTNRVIFNIGGNNYRIICTFFFGRTNCHLYINWIGTHSEYDKVCNKNQQFTIDKY